MNVFCFSFHTGAGVGRVVFCVLDIGQFSQCAQVVLCTLGVFVLFVVYGYVQELIFQLDGFKPFGFYLTLIQFCAYAFLSHVERIVRGDTTRKAPFKVHLILSLLSIGTMGFSNASLGYLNYPTQVVFKCCKLIPVLLGGILIQGKKYGALDFLAAVCMSTGLAAFVLADSQISPSFSILGVCLISFALLMDACIGNVQEKAMKSYSASDVEIIFFSYSFGAVWLLTSLLVSGQLSCAVNFCHEHPVETYGYGLVYSLTGYFGVQLVLTLVHIAGAFVAAVITTGRKVVTVTLSFVLFSKPFSIHYVWSGLLVLLGVYLHSIHKMHSKKKPVLASTKGSSNV
ncbi:adenosine 3'-phospho 5'-phosphosulfate transporter 2-like isoform X2 [Ornithodoros turicata]|uniref:adenosine 3'-phospho 5'-phosphosulfate transporter 2-like isoform X2 n=1 Tax=Ornithodoros turicata TaxID=34597 RepID=UPI003138D97C